MDHVKIKFLNYTLFKLSLTEASYNVLVYDLNILKLSTRRGHTGLKMLFIIINNISSKYWAIGYDTSNK